MATINLPSGKTPSQTKVASEFNYLSSLDLKEGMFKPEVSDIFVERFGRQDITGLLDMIGQKNQVSNIEFSHQEQDRIHGVFRVASAASAAAGSADVVMTINSAVSNYSYNGQSPYPTADTFSTTMPQVYDIIEVKGYQAIVKSVSAATLTLIPSDTTVDKPAISATDDIIILGNAFPEYSSGAESINSQVLDYTGYLQIMRGKHRVTGTAQNIRTWAEFTGKNGEKGYFWYLQGMRDEYHRFLNKREAILLAGKRINNLAGLAGAGTASIGDFNSITTTEGYIPQIEANGIVEGYASAGITLSDIDRLTKNLQTFRGDTENYLFVSHSLKLGIDALMKSEFIGTTSGTGSNGGLSFNQFNGKEEQFVKFSFKGFEYGGYNFAMKVLDTFSDPSFMGYSGGKYKDLGIVTPMGNTVTYNRMNSTTSATVPSLRVNYLGDQDGGSRYYKEWIDGNGMGVSTNDKDGFDVHMLSHVGLEAFALNRHALLVKE